MVTNPEILGISNLGGFFRAQLPCVVESLDDNPYPTAVLDCQFMGGSETLELQSASSDSLREGLIGQSVQLTIGYHDMPEVWRATYHVLSDADGATLMMRLRAGGQFPNAVLDELLGEVSGSFDISVDGAGTCLSPDPFSEEPRFNELELLRVGFRQGQGESVDLETPGADVPFADGTVTLKAGYADPAASGRILLDFGFVAG